MAPQPAVLGAPMPGAVAGIAPCPWHTGSTEGTAWALGFFKHHVISAGLVSFTRFSSSLPADPTQLLAFPHGCEPGSALTSSQKASAMPVLPHEGHDAGGGPSQFEKGVSQQFLCRGSLRGLPHQHRVQEAAEDRGDLKHHAGIRGGQKHPVPARLALCMLVSWEDKGHSDLPYGNSCAEGLWVFDVLLMFEVLGYHWGVEQHYGRLRAQV